MSPEAVLLPSLCGQQCCLSAQHTASRSREERAARRVLLARVLVVGAELARRHVARDTLHTWHTWHRDHQPRLGVLRQLRQQQSVARAHAAAGLEVTAESNIEQV